MSEQSRPVHEQPESASADPSSLLSELLVNSRTDAQLSAQLTAEMDQHPDYLQGLQLGPTHLLYPEANKWVQELYLKIMDNKTEQHHVTPETKQPTPDVLAVANSSVDVFYAQFRKLLGVNFEPQNNRAYSTLLLAESEKPDAAAITAQLRQIQKRYHPDLINGQIRKAQEESLKNGAPMEIDAEKKSELENKYNKILQNAQSAANCLLDPTAKSKLDSAISANKSLAQNGAEPVQPPDPPFSHTASNTSSEPTPPAPGSPEELKARMDTRAAEQAEMLRKMDEISTFHTDVMEISDKIGQFFDDGKRRLLIQTSMEEFQAITNFQMRLLSEVNSARKQEVSISVAATSLLGQEILAGMQAIISESSKKHITAQFTGDTLVVKYADLS